ncbi:MAG: nucleotidyltransferase domain-containing protein, partial [Abditibacteriales bacterium]|nr:nucleotidyltransferase domain-containing protein [Abditibacteriales bacterium]
VVRRIVAAIDPDKIILFGSYAHGTPHEWSDVDLFIIKSGSYSKFDLQGKVDSLFWDMSLPMDVLVRTPEAVERMAADPTNPFVRREVLEKGKVIYERGKPINTATVL